MSFIAGAGAVNVDLLYHHIPHIPKIGEEVYTDEFSMQLGGGIPATLINLSRLGVPVKLACELGTDVFSSFAAREMERCHIQPLNLYKGTDIPVNITSVMVLDGDRSFLSYGKGGLSTNSNAEERFYQMSKGAKLCCMENNGFLGAYKKLKADGTKLVLDIGWSDELSLESLSDYLELADYFTPNRIEALKITGKNTPEEAAEVLKQYFDKVLVKLDSEGCLIYEDTMKTVASFDEYTCVDATGAGDAFLAGFMYGLYYDYSFEDAVRFGNRTGGKAVTEVGALSAYLTEEELKQL